MFLSDRSHSQPAADGGIPAIGRSGKGRTAGTVKMGGGQGPGAEGRGEEAEHGGFRHWVLCDGIMKPTCPYRPIYTTECTTPGVDSDVNC